MGTRGDVVGKIAPQITRQDAGLDEGHLAQAQILVEQRVLQPLLLALLVGADDRFAAGLGELDRPPFPSPEVLGADLLSVDQRDGQAVGQPGPEFLHQIERQGRPVRPVGVQKADERVEAGGGQGGDAVVSDQGVEEREQAVDPVPRRASGAVAEGEVVALLLEEEREHGEVLLGGRSFRPAEGIEGPVGPEIVRAEPTELVEPPREGVGHAGESLLFGRIFVLARRAQEGVAGVLHLAPDDLAADGGATGGLVGGPELGAAEGDAGVGDAGEAGLEVAVFRKVVHRHAMLPAESERRGGDGDGSEGAEGFEVMDWEGDLARIGRSFAGALFPGELFRIDGDFDLQRQVVPGDERRRGREVEGVLDQVGHRRRAFRPRIRCGPVGRRDRRRPSPGEGRRRTTNILRRRA